MVRRKEIAIKHQEFVDALKFTPIRVTLTIQGYGGESYAGKVDRKIYDYFKANKFDLDEFAGDWDGEWYERVPSELQPFSPGSPFDCDNLWHASGAELSDLNQITVSDEQGKDLWVISAGHNELEDAGVEVVEYGGMDLEDLEEGTVVFNGAQGEKGCFFDGEFILKAPFDPKKLKISYENCDGWYIINYVEYDGEEIDGSGGYSTTGKWGENKWIIVGSDEEIYEPVPIEDREEDVDYTKFPTDQDIDDLEKLAMADELDCITEGTSDDFLQEAVDALNKEFATELSTTDKNPFEIMYGLTEWFDKDTKPARKGEYEVVYDAEWPNSGMGMAEWSGRSWKQNGKKLAIKQWRGLASEPYEGK